MTRRKTKFIIKTIILLIILMIAGYFSLREYRNFINALPNFEQAYIQDILPGIEQDYTYVIFENEIIELSQYPKVVDNKIYFPIEFVKSSLNENFYWDANENTLTYTTTEDVIRMKTDDLTYYVNNEPLNLNIPITTFEENIPYIPLELLLKFCDYDFTYNKDLDLIMIDDVSRDDTFVITNVNETYLRARDSETSRYIRKIYSGERFKVYDENDLWYYVRTEEGYFGYVSKVEMGLPITEIGKQEEYPSKDYSSGKQFPGKVNIVWHQVTTPAANSSLEDKMVGVHGLDVISPTWFALRDSEGNISNIADVDYVRWAHNNGYDVWGLFSNGFNSGITHDVLSSTEKREKVIKQILALASIYELDGINIDFENVAKEDGEHFVQFIKELTPYLKNQDLVVSVDMYVPSAWTAHYGREEIGQVIDYLIIMGYDEHWSTSPVSGSVASIGFVENGITKTIEVVPKEKVILGLPYYTRLWIEEEVDGKTEVSSKAYSMGYAYEILVENEANIIWDDSVAQYYGEYYIDEITYKIWLEEECSIEEKVKLVESYQLAGVAGWKLGLEKDEVWDVLFDYFKE